MNELVSVILPIYKVEKYLRECVDSILDQTYENLEIILVDDGSPDNCGIICDDYKEKDNRIKVIHKENGGLSDARNKGLEIAEGEWIAFVDSDDVISKRYVELMHDACHKNDAKMAWCNIIEMSDDGLICDNESEKSFHYNEYETNVNASVNIYSKQEAEGRMYTQEGMQKALVAWNKLYHRSLFNAKDGMILYPVGKIYEDGYTTYKLIYESNKVAEVPVPLYYYRQRGGSIMNKASNIQYVPALEAGIERMDFYIENGERELLKKEINYGVHRAIHYYKYATTRADKKAIKGWFKIIYNDYFIKENWPFGKRVRMKSFLMCYPLYSAISLFEGLYNKIKNKL